jgi:hypothetical protein
MAIRLLPFRDYDEHDVVNMYRSAGDLGEFINLSESAKRSTPQGDAGVFVKVNNGALNPALGDWDPVDIASNPDSLLGKTDYPHVARNNYPQTALSVTGVGASGDPCLGVTLRQTVARDELGENLLYNPVKKDELFGVLPGEAVPVLSKGMISLTDQAIVGSPSVGDCLVPHSEGRASGVAGGTVPADANKIGTVLASGFRNDDAGSLGGTNVFGNAGYQSGLYYIVKIDCA